jgi:hypothetical protein
MAITIRPELEAELEALALEGLNSGASIEADDKYWAVKRQRLIDRHLTTGSRLVDDTL